MYMAFFYIYYYQDLRNSSICRVRYALLTHHFHYTPTGRATVSELQLNRPGLVNPRRALYTLGEHPPILIINDQ